MQPAHPGAMTTKSYDSVAQGPHARSAPAAEEELTEPQFPDYPVLLEVNATVGLTS